MRIGIDCRGIQTFPDGIGRYTRSVVRGVLRRDRENEYILFQQPGVDITDLVLQVHNVRMVQVPYRHLSLGTVFRFGELVEASGVDVLHIPFFVGPWRCSVPTVVTVHDLMALTMPAFFSGRSRLGEKAAWAFHRLFVPRTIRQARVVLADSEFTKKEIVRVLSIPEDRIEVVYPALEERFLKSGAPEVGPEEKGAPYFAYMGNTKPYKNVPGLLRGFAEAKAKKGEEGLRLVLIGPKDRFREAVERQAAELGILEAVEMPGELSDAEAAGVIRGAVGFCFPSLSEGFGLPVLEAMALGAPVIASNVASLPEVVGNAGLMIDPENPSEIGEAMIRLLEDSNLVRESRERGLLRAVCFSEEGLSARILDVYRKAGGNI